MNLKEWNWRGLRHVVMLFGCLAVIIWLGGSALSHIGELYDGLCQLQGPGMGRLLYDNNPQGYCSGIGADLSILGFIMLTAAAAVIATLVLWWDRTTK